MGQNDTLRSERKEKGFSIKSKAGEHRHRKEDITGAVSISHNSKGTIDTPSNIEKSL